VLIVEVHIGLEQRHFNTQQSTFDNRHSCSNGLRHGLTIGMIASVGSSSAGLQSPEVAVVAF
jgi:hypothetical protein